MKKILSIKAIENYKLLCSFSDGAVKIADIFPYLQGEAFKPLLNLAAFSKVENRNFYAEWPQYELDLSADTLWHIGKEVSS